MEHCSLTINGQTQQHRKGITVLQLLEHLGHGDRRGLAVAVNDAVHPRSGWGKQELHDGDQVTLIRAAAGG